MKSNSIKNDICPSLQKQSQIFTIQIEKQAGQTLGFYINKIQNGIFINEINKDGLLKLLCVNDEIVGINNTRIKDMDLDEIVGLLSSLTSFSLTIKRIVVDSLKVEDFETPKTYDIINGKVDQSYSHKLFINKNYSDDEDEVTDKVKNLFNYYSNNKNYRLCNEKKNDSAFLNESGK
jgi:hypothetical protein